MLIMPIHRKVVRGPAFYFILYVYSYSYHCFKEVIIARLASGGALDRSRLNTEVCGLEKSSKCVAMIP